MKLRALAQEMIRAVRLVGRPKQRILVASVPRCGSTLLLRAVGLYRKGASSAKHSPDFQFVRDLEPLPSKPYLKTHSPAPSSLPEDVRAVFLFGDPIASVVSTFKNRFERNHFANCGYVKREPPKIYERDDLRYEHIFDTWMAPNPYPVLAMRYEKMFDNKHWLDDYLGFAVALEPFRQRSTQVDGELREQLESVYGSLVAKVSAAPDVAIIGE